jgi:serine/threonine protein kinase
MSDEQQIHNDLAGLVGSVLAGIYRLDALIGEGGMGAVYRGRHVMLRRDVAIKVLHPDFSRDPELVKRFDREAQSAARLNHPNCIQVTEFGSTDDGMKYLVMQLLEGTELQNILDGPTSPERAVDLILQILRGLEHAHGQGVVHRDLKPQNIFVTRDHEGREVLKLVDFGIAKIIGGDGALEQMTRAGMVFGTPQYMSPEQALGLEIDARADLYAAGVLLYQIVTGRLPFNSDDPVALIRMQVSTEPPPLPPSVPQELAAIIFRLLAKQKEQRYPDARTVRIALERYRESLNPRGAKAAGSDPLLDVVTTGGPDLSGLVAINRPLPDALRPRPLTMVEAMMDTDRLHRRPWFRALMLFGGIAVLVGGAALWWFVLRTPPAVQGPPEIKGARTVDSPVTPKKVETKAETPDSPPETPTWAGPSPQQLRDIDDLLTQDKPDEAAARLAELRAAFPQDGQVRWREASLQAGRPDGAAKALPLYAEALALAPTLARDLGFHAQVDALLRRRPIGDAAIDLALALGPQGHGVLLNYINDPKGWANYAQRRKIRDALEKDPTAAAEIDAALNARRDLWQVSQSPTPCQTMQAALMVMQATPSTDHIDALKAAVVPVVPVPAEGQPPVSDVEKAACKDVEGLLAGVRTQYAQAYPAAFPDPKKKKKKPVKKKRR